MTALVYEEEIRAQFDCSRCQATPSVWESLGRCTGPIPGEQNARLRVDLTDFKTGQPVSTSEPYPAEFGTCPRALLREDLNPDAMAVARFVSRAVACEADLQMDAPNRLFELGQRYRLDEAQKQEARALAAAKASAHRG